MEMNSCSSLQGPVEQMVAKLASLESEASSEKGDFALFAVVLREDAPDRWDLLVSAPWLDANKKQGLHYLANEIKERLDARERLSLSRIAILEEGNPLLAAVQTALSIQHGRAELRDCIFFNVQIKHAYIITAMKN